MPNKKIPSATYTVLFIEVSISNKKSIPSLSLPGRYVLTLPGRVNRKGQQSA